MVLTGSTDTDLLLALQAAAVGRDGWRDFLERLADATGARLAVWSLCDPASGATVATQVAGPSDKGLAAPAAVWNVLLPSAMRPERVYTTAEMADLVGADSLEQALAALDLRSLRAMRVPVPDEALSVGLGIFSDQPLSAADGAVLRRLFPFVRGNAATAAVLQRERMRAEVATALALDRTLGWVLLDAAGGVVDAVLDDDAPLDLVARPGRRLGLGSTNAERQLAHILATYASASDRSPRAIRFGADTHLRVDPLHADHAPRGAIALVRVEAGLAIADRDAALVVDGFGLLPSEARLAIALAQGRRLTDAARSLGLSTETARTYSKAIFAKTGAHGQADLVRRIYAFGLGTRRDGRVGLTRSEA